MSPPAKERLVKEALVLPVGCEDGGVCPHFSYSDGRGRQAVLRPWRAGIVCTRSLEPL